VASSHLAIIMEEETTAVGKHAVLVFHVNIELRIGSSFEIWNLEATSPPGIGRSASFHL
jgi:hypothetical protein